MNAGVLGFNLLQVGHVSFNKDEFLFGSSVTLSTSACALVAFWPYFVAAYFTDTNIYSSVKFKNKRQHLDAYRQVRHPNRDFVNGFLIGMIKPSSWILLLLQSCYRMNKKLFFGGRNHKALVSTICRGVR